MFDSLACPGNCADTRTWSPRPHQARKALGVNGRGITGHAPEPGHPASQLPRLTVAMVAWLQAFSDSWEFRGGLVS